MNLIFFLKLVSLRFPIKQRFTCLLSLFNGYGGQYTMGWGWVDIPMVYRPPYPWYIDPLPMVYRPPYHIQLLTFNAVYSWLYVSLGQSFIDQVRIVMSRLKLKVNNCLLNNKEFFKLFKSMFNKIGYNCFIIFQDYLNIKILKYDENFEILWNFWVLKLLNFNFFLDNFDPLPMVYWSPYPWNIDPLPMVYRPPYLWYFDPPTHGILTPLSMVYWPPTHGILNPYPWYIDPPIHGILTPLPIKYRPPYTWYFDLPAYLLIRNGGFKIPWRFNLPYREVQFSIRGFNIPWM
jgi:hypothetical protein